MSPTPVPMTVDAESSKAPAPSQSVQMFFKNKIKVNKNQIKAMSKHLKYNSEEGISVSTTLPFFYDYQVWKALNKVVDIQAVVAFDKTKKDKWCRAPPIYTQVDIDYNKTDIALFSGYVFGIYNGKPVVLKEQHDNEGGLILTTYSLYDKESCNALLQHITNASKQFSPYTGKKMFYMGNRRLNFAAPSRIHLNDIILDSETCNVLQEQFLFPIQHASKLREAGLPLKRGILIDGKPGTGKTLFGKALMNECSNATMIFVTARSLSYADDITNIFEYARALQVANVPTIVFFEDIDLIGASRDISYTRNMLGELLTQMDGVLDNQGIYVIGTTNNKAILDSALSMRPGRFDLTIEFKLPETEQRQKIVAMYDYGLDEDVRKRIVDTTKNFTPAQIRELLIKTRITEIVNSKKVTEESLDKLARYTENGNVGTPYK
jgi:AAA+ superfamily predicted ATPase